MSIPDSRVTEAGVGGAKRVRAERGMEAVIKLPGGLHPLASGCQCVVTVKCLSPVSYTDA